MILNSLFAHLMLGVIVIISQEAFDAVQNLKDIIKSQEVNINKFLKWKN